MFEESKLDTTILVGSDIRMLIMRIARLEAELSDEEWLGLCAGDHVNETEVQRTDINKLIKNRKGKYESN